MIKPLEYYFKDYISKIWLPVVFVVASLLLINGCSEAFGAQTVSSAVNLKIVAQIESSGDSKAYHAQTKATGMYQITPICLKDYNQYHSKKFVLNEMFDPSKAQLVANWYLNTRIPGLLRHYGQVVTIRNQLIAWNAGIKYVNKRLPKETINYINKYNKLKG